MMIKCQLRNFRTPGRSLLIEILRRGRYCLTASQLVLC